MICFVGNKKKYPFSAIFGAFVPIKNTNFLAYWHVTTYFDD
jgi:hypothetical protein